MILYQRQFVLTLLLVLGFLAWRQVGYCQSPVPEDPATSNILNAEEVQAQARAEWEHCMQLPSPVKEACFADVRAKLMGNNQPYSLQVGAPPGHGSKGLLYAVPIPMPTKSNSGVPQAPQAPVAPTPP